MNDPAHPLGPVGHLALVTGLASAEADTRVAAAELWSDACADGRLDPVLAATALVTGVGGQALKLSRVADSLQHAANSPIAARRVVETVCASAEALADAAAANLHALIELAARLGATVGAPELPGAVTALASRGGGSARQRSSWSRLPRGGPPTASGPPGKRSPRSSPGPKHGELPGLGGRCYLGWGSWPAVRYPGS